MLDEIISKNSELLKHLSIVPILRKIEEFIPENARENFYRNLITLKIEFKEEIDLPSSYKFFSNKIEITTDFKKCIKLDGKLEEEYFNYIFEATLFHELLHMSSTKVYQDTNLIHTGFSAIIPSYEDKELGKTINNYLNEGFTEMITQLFYPLAYAQSGYQDTVNIAHIITSILGLDYIKNLYFSGGLAIRLKNSMSMFSNIEYIDALFYNIEFLPKDSKTFTIYNIVSSLLPILDGALKSGIQNGMFLSKEDFDIYYKSNIETSFIEFINMMSDNKGRKNFLIEEVERYKQEFYGYFDYMSINNSF